MHRLKLLAAVCTAASALALTACGGGSGTPLLRPTSTPSPSSSATPTVKPSATPTVKPTATPFAPPTPDIVDASVSAGLPVAAVPYAVSAGKLNVWITDRGPKALDKVSIPVSASGTQEIATVGSHDPLEVAPDEIGGLVYTEASGSSFGRYTPANGQMNEFALKNSSGVDVPSGLTERGITANVQGKVFVAVGSTSASAAGQGIYTVDLASANHGTALIPTGYDPVAVALDHNGGLWVAEGASNQIEVFDSTGKLLKTLSVSLNSPAAMVEGSDHFMYAVENGGQMAKFDESAYSVTPYSIGTCKAAYVAAGVNNDLWFSSPQCNAVIGFSLKNQTITQVVNGAHSGGKPDHISVDSSGHVWFTDSALHKVFEYLP